MEVLTVADIGSLVVDAVRVDVVLGTDGCTDSSVYCQN